jgi:flagellar biosynthesis protein FlhB
MSEFEQGEKTEEATPEKERKAREEGQFARSKDGGAVAASVAVLLCILALGSSNVIQMREFALYCFGNSEALLSGNLGVLGQRCIRLVLWMVIPVALAAGVAGAGIGLTESGLLFRLELVEPKWERLDPISRIRQLFSLKQGTVSVISSLLRVCVVGFVAFTVVKDSYPSLVKLARADLSAGVMTVLGVALRLVVWSILALVILAGLDYGQSFLRIRKELMMTREELKEEYKQQEGDPKIRARQRARAREMLKRGILKEVKRADVVIANPTHICVALRYRPAEGAPVVTAKGYDEVAFYIRKIAEENGIVVVENKPLARALAESTKVGRTIPVDLYQAVAQVLAFVYRLRGRRIRG